MPRKTESIQTDRQASKQIKAEKDDDSSEVFPGQKPPTENKHTNDRKNPLVTSPCKFSVYCL